MDRRKGRYASCVFVALLTLALMLWAGRVFLLPSPYLGIELLGDGHIYEVDPEGPAFRAGLREHDRVLSVDGDPLFRSATLLAGKSVGEGVRLRIERSGVIREFSLTLSRPTREALALQLELLLVGAVFWAVGVLVWMLRPAAPVTWLFFLLSQVVAVRLFAEVLDPDVPWAMLLSDVLKVFLGPVVLHFYASFPTALPQRTSRWLLRAGYAGATVLSLLALTAPLWATSRAASALLWTSLRAFEVLFLLIAVAVLLRPLRAASLQSRRRRRILVAGMLVGIFPVLAFTLLPGLLLGIPLLPYLWTLPCAAIVPLAYAYAVYQGELGQVDWVLNRSLVYFLLTALLLGLYALLFFGLDRALVGGRTWSHLLSGAGLIVVTSILFVPLRARLQQWVDRFFYGGWYDYRSLVQAVSADLSQTIDLQDLLGKLKRAAQTMRFQAGCVLWVEQGVCMPLVSYRYSAEDLASMHLSADGALARFVKASGGPCSLHTLREALAGSALDEAEHLLLNKPHHEYWVPLSCRGTLHGILVARDHQGEEELDAEDLAILATLAAQAAIACENIALLESLRVRLAEVEQVRDELAETQRRLAEGREAERLHLARELHDGPVQDLYAMAHGLEVLVASLHDQKGVRRLASLHETIQEVAGTLRDICTELRPPLLADLGLCTAIRAHAARFQEKHPGLAVCMALPPDEPLLPEQMRLALFRIYQEALHNALQHGRARQVSVRFDSSAEQISLRIEDNGEGFVVPARWIELGRRGHLGLLGISERAESIGGVLEVQSAPSNGTRLCVAAPGLLESRMPVEHASKRA